MNVNNNNNYDNEIKNHIVKLDCKIISFARKYFVISPKFLILLLTIRNIFLI